MSIEDTGRDPQVEGLLDELDPGRNDETYWPRFHRSAMNRALEELARRRVVADLTVADLVSSWGRTLVPTAAVAAAVAGFFLLRAPQAQPEEIMVAVEDVLVDDGAAIPDLLDDDRRPDALGVAFVSETF